MGHNENTIKKADVPWSDAVVMVCTKCSRKIVGDEKLADDFKKSLKSAFKDAGLGKRVRSVTSSCLDVCPKNRMAIAIVRRNNGTEVVTVEPNILETELFERVRAMAVQS